MLHISIYCVPRMNEFPHRSVKQKAIFVFSMSITSNYMGGNIDSISNFLAATIFIYIYVCMYECMCVCVCVFHY